MIGILLDENLSASLTLPTKLAVHHVMPAGAVTFRFPSLVSCAGATVDRSDQGCGFFGSSIGLGASSVGGACKAGESAFSAVGGAALEALADG